MPLWEQADDHLVSAKGGNKLIGRITTQMPKDGREARDLIGLG